MGGRHGREASGGREGMWEGGHIEGGKTVRGGNVGGGHMGGESTC